MHFKMLTPEKLVVERDVQNIVIPGSEGYIGFLEGHIPFVTPLKTGMVEIVNEKNTAYYAVSGGYCEVSSQEIIILAEKATNISQIKKEETGEILKKVQQLLQQTPVDSDQFQILAREAEWAELCSELAHKTIIPKSEHS